MCYQHWPTWQLIAVLVTRKLVRQVSASYLGLLLKDNSIQLHGKILHWIQFNWTLLRDTTMCFWKWLKRMRRGLQGCRLLRLNLYRASSLISTSTAINIYES